MKNAEMVQITGKDAEICTDMEQTIIIGFGMEKVTFQNGICTLIGALAQLYLMGASTLSPAEFGQGLAESLERTIENRQRQAREGAN